MQTNNPDQIIPPSTGAPADELIDDPFTYLGRGMSISRLGCKPAAAVIAEGPVHMATITGTVVELATKVDPKSGEAFLALKGSFIGVNHQTDAGYRSGLCFLPGSFHDQVVTEHQLKPENSGPIDIGMTIWAVPSSAPIGYSYEGRSIIQVRKNDHAVKMLQTIVAASKRLILGAPAPISSLTGPAEAE